MIDVPFSTTFYMIIITQNRVVPYKVQCTPGSSSTGSIPGSTVSRFGVAEFDGLGKQFASERAFWKALSAVHHCPRQSAAPRRCLPEPSAIQPSGWWRLHRSWCG